VPVGRLIIGVRRPIVRLYGAQGCSLCDRARAQLERLQAELAFELEEVDITGVDELEARYREWLPVVEINGERAFVYYVDEAALLSPARLERLAVELGLGRVVKLDKPGDFVGRAALERAAREGIAKRLVGLIVTGRGIARHGHPVFAADRATGIITSGTHSPTLGVAIAMAYVAPGDGEPGTILDVEIRDQRVSAEVVALPFYKRSPRTDG